MPEPGWALPAAITSPFSSLPCPSPDHSQGTPRGITLISGLSVGYLWAVSKVGKLRPGKAISSRPFWVPHLRLGVSREGTGWSGPGDLASQPSRSWANGVLQAPQVPTNPDPLRGLAYLELRRRVQSLCFYQGSLLQAQGQGESRPDSVQGTGSPCRGLGPSQPVSVK